MTSVDMSGPPALTVAELISQLRELEPEAQVWMRHRCHNANCDMIHRVCSIEAGLHGSGQALAVLDSDLARDLDGLPTYWAARAVHENQAI